MASTLTSEKKSAAGMPLDKYGNPIPHDRAVLTAGLTYHLHAKGTVEVTGGAAGSDTFVVKVNSIAIMLVVGWNTSHSATAILIANAINTFFLANYTKAAADDGDLFYFATVSAAVVTVHQVNPGTITGALATTVVNSATTTDVDFAGDTDSVVPIYAGITTVPSANYLTLGFDKTKLIFLTETEQNELAPVSFFPAAAQDFELFAGRLEPGASSAVPAGRTVAAASTRDIPWVDASALYVFKPASNGVWDYSLGYIS